MQPTGGLGILMCPAHQKSSLQVSLSVWFPITFINFFGRFSAGSAPKLQVVLVKTGSSSRVLKMPIVPKILKIVPPRLIENAVHGSDDAADARKRQGTCLGEAGEHPCILALTGSI